MAECSFMERRSGDHGQRYEVRALDADNNDIEFVVGWTNEAGGGDLVRGVNAHPAWHSPRVIDRRHRP